ncbi:MAG: putative metal-dependent hydrolase [Vicinamibacterales bacterium]|jgi:hypothetical protein|nr:metal-dependent hydrolase [Acidobacteriota bacterium]MDP6371995.1 putative metal-dependent hydrolase [Vicinamibacterales bacterium]MDP6608847.1 putative metal-dependent hydrolase [Vicinamibacterales bacterium]HAK55852.1 putative metal-dependent hydrolase [Acidobacteriota bacterium]|tara:strand:- start:930 stop:1454 length:525 start_codon:yes stop_codon:yes gene_type:complete
MSSLNYPIGELKLTKDVTATMRGQWIDEIATAPAELRRAVEGLDDRQLDTPYRPDGWTVRQVVHHVFDSHVNSYVRFKWALTEDAPAIKVYDQADWAELTEARTAPVKVSLAALEQLHARWVLMLRGLSPADLARTLTHPELGALNLDDMLQIYAWHGRHHTAHVTGLREREGW